MAGAHAVGASAAANSVPGPRARPAGTPADREAGVWRGTSASGDCFGAGRYRQEPPRPGVHRPAPARVSGSPGGRGAVRPIWPDPDLLATPVVVVNAHRARPVRPRAIAGGPPGADR